MSSIPPEQSKDRETLTEGGENATEPEGQAGGDKESAMPEEKKKKKDTTEAAEPARMSGKVLDQIAMTILQHILTPKEEAEQRMEQYKGLTMPSEVFREMVIRLGQEHRPTPEEERQIDRLMREGKAPNYQTERQKAIRQAQDFEKKIPMRLSYPECLVFITEHENQQTPYTESFHELGPELSALLFQNLQNFQRAWQREVTDWFEGHSDATPEEEKKGEDATRVVEISKEILFRTTNRVTKENYLTGKHRVLYMRRLKSKEGQAYTDAQTEFFRKNAALENETPEFVDRERCMRFIDDMNSARASILDSTIQKLGEPLASIIRTKNAKIANEIRSESERMFAEAEKAQQTEAQASEKPAEGETAPKTAETVHLPSEVPKRTIQEFFLRIGREWAEGMLGDIPLSETSRTRAELEYVQALRKFVAKARELDQELPDDVDEVEFGTFFHGFAAQAYEPLVLAVRNLDEPARSKGCNHCGNLFAQLILLKERLFRSSEPSHEQTND